jgi:Ca-activated chloride channel homolog
MRKATTRLLALAAGVSAAQVAAAQTPNQPEPETARSLAPYFVVPGSEQAAEALPLKETSAEVAIAGVIARVKVRQQYENTGRTPIEAVYVFPASTRAAVHGMRMKIGQRTIEARIDRREKARADYEAARQAGQRASLLEQERPNVFTMNVANIMPGDTIAVELEYSELVVPEEGVYEFVYPTVVGPRYGGGADPARDGWIENPYLKSGQPQPYRFDIQAHVETGIPLKELSSPSHKVNVSYQGPARADVRLDGAGGGNRDFVLRYRLADDRIEAGVLLWEGAGAGGARERFFALMMEPPVRPRATQIPPREYVFLVDVSGSMHGFPIETTKALMRKLLGGLRPTDQFNVVLFSGRSHTLSPDGSLAATPENIAQATTLLDGQRGGGGTELLAGLQASYQIPRRDRSMSRTVVVVTDGYVGVEAQTYRFVRERLDQANLFAFGIGSSVNRGLIEGMARAGQGEPFVVLQAEKAAAEAERFRAYIEQPVLTQVSVSFHGFSATDVAPQKLPDLMARRPLILFGKYRGPASGRIEVSGMTGTGRFHQTVQVRPEGVRQENAALRWLWARKQVAVLDDDRQMAQSQTAEAAITKLGLEYNLLTAFTSFVAVDSQVVNQGGKSATVKQPLPLPEGVSELAVGVPKVAFDMSALNGSGLSGSHRMLRRQSADSLSVQGIVGPAGAPLLDGPAPAPRPTRPMAKPRTPTPPAAEEPARSEPAAGAEIQRADSVDDARPLAARVKALLAASSCAHPAPRVLRLRLQVNAVGRVLAVELLEGDEKYFACVKRALLRLTTLTRGQGGKAGTVELRLAKQPGR